MTNEACPSRVEQVVSVRSDTATEVGRNKKALVSEGFSDKQVLDLVGCAGKI